MIITLHHWRLQFTIHTNCSHNSQSIIVSRTIPVTHRIIAVVFSSQFISKQNPSFLLNNIVPLDPDDRSHYQPWPTAAFNFPPLKHRLQSTIPYHFSLKHRLQSTCRRRLYNLEWFEDLSLCCQYLAPERGDLTSETQTWWFIFEPHLILRHLNSACNPLAWDCAISNDSRPLCTAIELKQDMIGFTMCLCLCRPMQGTAEKLDEKV